MTPVLIPCSRNAHDENVLVRRPQWDQHGCHSKRGEKSELGKSRWTHALAFGSRTVGTYRVVKLGIGVGLKVGFESGLYGLV